MKEIKVTYDGDIKTTVGNGKSAILLKTDNSPKSNASGTTLTPVDLFVGSVGACMVSMIGYTATQKGLNVDGLTAQMTYGQDETTHAVNEINVVFNFNGAELDEKAQRMLTAAAKTCPVGASINPEIKKSLVFKF